MVTRRILVAGAAAAAVSPLSARAEQDAFASQAVLRGRATVPVMLDGKGPFQFMVDTAATASVISNDLLEHLQLQPFGEVAMHTLVGREVVPAVRVGRLRSGVLDVHDMRVAVGRRIAMGGLDGLLGCDLLARKRIVLNFRGRASTSISRSRAPARGLPTASSFGTPIVVSGERRFGNLLMIPAQAGRASVVAIIDSGAEGTVLNRAAAQAGFATPLTFTDGQDIRRIQSPSGEVTMAQAMLLPSLRFGGFTLSRLPVAVGDFHSFRVLGLEEQPAMLIGLDILGLFGSVQVDLGRNELGLQT